MAGSYAHRPPGTRWHGSALNLGSPRPGRRWTAHTRADGSRIEFRYDRAGLKVATVDPLGHETLIERDDHGQVIAQTGPDGTRWAIERDALGQPLVTQYDYDEAGRLVA